MKQPVFQEHTEKKCNTAQLGGTKMKFLLNSDLGPVFARIMSLLQTQGIKRDNPEVVVL